MGCTNCAAVWKSCAIPPALPTCAGGMPGWNGLGGFMNEEKFEAVMEAVCDIYHWPFVCGEVSLEEKCGACPVEKMIRAVMGL